MSHDRVELQFLRLRYELWPPGLNRQALSSMEFELSRNGEPAGMHTATVECNLMEATPDVDPVLSDLPEWADAGTISACAAVYRSLVVKRDLLPRIYAASAAGLAYSPPPRETVECAYVCRIEVEDGIWTCTSRNLE